MRPSQGTGRRGGGRDAASPALSGGGLFRTETAGTLESRINWPWKGVDFSPAFLSFLLYIFVVTSYVVPLAQVAMGLAAIFLTMGGKDRWRAPAPMVVLLLFAVFVALGYHLTRFSVAPWEPLLDLMKVIVVGWVGLSVLNDRPRVRFFVFYYLAVFALFPLRGAYFNKFIYNALTQGRVGWNNLFENPNDLAALCILPLGLAASVLFTERNKLIKQAALLGLITLPLLIFMTQSRGAIIALGAALILNLIVQGKGRMRTLLIMGAAGLVISIFAPEEVWGRLTSLRSATSSGNLTEANDSKSAEQRFEIMKVAATVAKEFPVTGVGWSAYPNAHFVFSKRSEFKSLAAGGRDAHNTFLTLAAETGFTGLALWLFVVYLFVRPAIQGMRAIKPFVPEYALQLKFLLLSLAAFLMAGMFGSYAHMASTYIHLVVVYAMGALATKEAAERLRSGGAEPSGVPTRIVARRVG